MGCSNPSAPSSDSTSTDVTKPEPKPDPEPELPKPVIIGKELEACPLEDLDAKLVGDGDYTIHINKNTIASYEVELKEDGLPTKNHLANIQNVGKIKSVIFDEGVTEIPDCFFCDEMLVGNQAPTRFAITNVYLPETVNKIGEFAFAFLPIKSITIPEGVTSIGNGAFGCTALTSITIPDSVTAIGVEAFAYCTALESITIPDSVTAIGVEAFAYCTALESITIPDSVTSIGKYIFGECKKLKLITFKGTTAQWNKTTKGVELGKPSGCTVTCTDGEITE